MEPQGLSAEETIYRLLAVLNERITDCNVMLSDLEGYEAEALGQYLGIATRERARAYREIGVILMDLRTGRREVVEGAGKRTCVCVRFRRGQHMLREDGSEDYEHGGRNEITDLPVLQDSGIGGDPR